MKQARRVLIMCDLYPPAFGPRMGYLVKYMSKAGWMPQVLTEESADATFALLDGYCPVTRLPAINPLTKAISGSRRMYRAACDLMDKHRFDAILCSTYREFPLDAARRVASRYGIPLLVDLRDIIEQYSGSEFIATRLPRLVKEAAIPIFRKYSLYVRNKALKAAAAVTTVSPWHVEQLKKYNHNVHLIYNGYDPELFRPETVRTDKFTVTYTGRVLSLAMRDPSLLFEGLARLTATGSITPADFRVRWYIDDASRDIIEPEAARAGVADYMEYPGYVPAKDIPGILNASSVLLLLTNKSSDGGPKGVMTTKFFESLAVRKPILCVRSDESLLAAMLTEAMAGTAAADIDTVCDFLLRYYNEWRISGHTGLPATADVPAIYSRAEQAEQFMQLIESSISLNNQIQ